jgi:glycosyltransferase involved in cell wall biosynthesis
MTKIIALMWCRDEVDILPQVLESLQWVDGLAVIDNGSTDGSWKILEGCPKVLRQERDLHLQDNRYFTARLLELAKQDGADWYVAVDADEVFPDMRYWIENVVGEYNTITANWRNVLTGKIQKNFTRVYRNVPELFDLAHIKVMHGGKCPIPRGKRKVYHSGLEVQHYQIRSREQGLRKYENYLRLDPDWQYQPQGYEHLKEQAMLL